MGSQHVKLPALGLRLRLEQSLRTRVAKAIALLARGDGDDKRDELFVE